MTLLDTPTTPTTPAGPRLSSRGVVRSELRKLTSLRSTRVAALCVPLLVALGTLLQAFVLAHTLGPVPVHVTSEAAWRRALSGGTGAGELAGAVLAALAVGSGYAGRVALTTFVAVPRRLLVGAAQVVALLVPLAVLTAVGFLVGAALSLPLVRSTAGTGSTGVAALVGIALGDVVVVLVCALLALAVTTLVRSTAGGVTIALAVLLVLPVAVPSLHAVLGVDLVPYLLTYAAPMAAALHDPDGSGALVRDLVVTLAWVVVPGAGAALALVRRDV